MAKKSRLSGLVWGTVVFGSCSCSQGPEVKAQVLSQPVQNADATWPWTKAEKVELAKGVRHWGATGKDGCSLDLLEFDFKENPNLRFGIYDQDQDDAKPFDNQADYFPRGVGQIVGHLNKNKEVLAAWNGLFFGYDRGPSSPPGGWANHVGPVVLDGKAYHNVGRHRWMFGVKDGKCNAIFKPDMKQLPSEFDFAADGAQLLIREGKPLRIQSFQDSIQRKRVQDTPDDAGSIPIVDWMKTSRTSMAWSKDHRYFWVLVVVESDHEVGSKLATKYGYADPSGWTLADLQEFWQSRRVWAAINSDGGVVTQLAFRNQDKSYDVIASQQSKEPGRRRTNNLGGTPDGGSLLTFYVHFGGGDKRG